MNRDRLPDLVCAETYGGRLHVLASQGDGTFHGAFATDATVSDPQVADLNRDGRLDVVLASGEIWLGDGTGRLTPSLDAHLIARLGCRPDVQRVHVGDVIAKAGSTGRSTGSHVHFEVWYKGNVVNPLAYVRNHR